MCNKNNSTRRSKRKPKPRSLSMRVKHSRKTRSKTRKPKYLSLHRLQENLPQRSSSDNSNNSSKEVTDKQLNLFPLHPENLVEDRDTQYDNVSLLFNTTEEDGGHAVTLNGLLDSEGSHNYKNETAATVASEESPLSPSLTYGCYSCDYRTRLSLVRTAMKGKKERDESEERWVVYSEVVEKKEMEEVSSGGGGGHDGGAWRSKRKKTKKVLALKLDYEGIMNAWSDKGPLYIEGESPQTVPQLHEAYANGWESASNVWKVPEMDERKKGHREASVLRYKEKRQNRLFSKRVRYQVRKLNAENRPRLKGRFVKRD